MWRRLVCLVGVAWLSWRVALPEHVEKVRKSVRIVLCLWYSRPCLVFVSDATTGVSGALGFFRCVPHARRVFVTDPLQRQVVLISANP